MKREITKLWKSGRMPLAIAAVALALGSTPVHAQEQGGTETPDENVMWVDVTNQFITNPGFTEGGTGWSARTNAPNSFNTQYCNAEYYDRAGTCYQTISGLEAGQNYKLTVRGFHRAGGNDNGAAYEAGTEVIKTLLYAGDQQVTLKSLYSEPKDNTLPNRLNDWPNGMEGMRAYIDKYPDSYLNELEFTATGAPIEIGINNTVRESRWTCFTDFKLYVASGSLYEALQAQINGLEQLVPELDSAGLTQAATTLRTTIGTYERYGEQTDDKTINAAIAAIPDIIATTNTLVTAANSLHTAINDCETFNTTNAITNLKNQLSTLIGNAKKSFSGCALTDEAAAGLDAATTELNNLTTVGEELMAAINNCKNYANGEGKVITNLPATLASSVEAAKAVELGNDAIAALNAKATELNDLLAAGQNLMTAINNCETFLKNFTEEVNATHAEKLTQSIATAKVVVLTEDATTTMNNEAAALNTMFINADGWISLAFVLNKAKALADQIGGLNNEEAYKKVVADLNDADLTYAAMAADVAALNVVCRNAMTPKFLAQAASESPIDFTSFIKNPNVYQTGERTQGANDWNCNKGSADGGDYTNGTLNTELYCYSWTGWRIKESQYSQQLSDLPDGAYKLEAATCTNFGSGNIYLYASIDNANILWNTNFNDNENTYNEACANLATTTSLTFVVQGGNIHIGVIGNKDTGTGGNGKWWKADNFRLYYIGTPEDLDIAISDAGYATYYAPNAFRTHSPCRKA